MTDTPLSALMAGLLTSIPTGGGVLIARPSPTDPSKFVFAAVDPASLGTGTGTGTGTGAVTNRVLHRDGSAVLRRDGTTLLHR